jgi:glycosyltransferase involved in cell wall biosynthesis
MHILYVTHGYKPSYRIGGPIWSVAAVAERLVQRGHKVTVFTTNINLDTELKVETNVAIDVAGVEVWYFKTATLLKAIFPLVPHLSKSLGFLYCPGMNSRLNEMMPGIDLVHTQLPFIYPTWAAIRSARRHQKPIVYHQRGVLDPNRLKFRSLKKWLYIFAVERRNISTATILIALTDAEVASYRALGISNPIRVIPNGVEVRATSHSYLDEVEGIASDAFVILFLGRLHPLKGVGKLLDAFRLLHEKHKNAILVMAGPDEYGQEDGFRKVACHLGIEHRVLFPGMVEGAKKEWLLTRADLFCLPSVGEGFSIAVLEALAHGVPVVLSPGCHFAEVEAAGAGLVVEPSSSMIAAAIDSLIKNPKRLAEMGHRGKKLVAENYSWESITDLIEGCYLEATKRNSIEGHKS